MKVWLLEYGEYCPVQVGIYSTAEKGWAAAEKHAESGGLVIGSKWRQSSHDVDPYWFNGEYALYPMDLDGQ